MGHTPSTAGTFRKQFRRNSGKTLETLSERFLEFPSRVRLGSPKHYNSRHLEAPEHFQNCLPPQYGWGRFFFKKWFRRGPLRAGHGIPSSTGGISESVFTGTVITIRSPVRLRSYCVQSRAESTRAGRAQLNYFPCSLEAHPFPPRVTPFILSI